MSAKIVNMRGIVRRRAALPGRECLESLQQLGRRARGAPTVETLLGIEGTATAQYFATWPEKPGPAPPRKVKVALDRTPEGYQWRLEAPQDWKAEVLLSKGSQ